MTQQQNGLTRVQPQKNRGGRWVPIGGEEYLVPPLALGTIVTLQDDVEKLKDMPGGRPTVEQMQLITKLVHSGIKRNYPSMTEDEVGEMIDLDNWQDVVGAVLSIAGFKKSGGAAPSGEAPASDGTASTGP